MATNSGPVGKIVQMKSIEPLDLHLQLLYNSLMANAEKDGFFNSTKPVASVSPGRPWSPGLVVIHNRGGRQFVEPAWLDMPVWIGDLFTTNSNTVVAIEFIIGGRVGINKDSCVKIVSERSVADDHVEIKKIIQRLPGMWAKMAKLKEPLEIQTNGGVLGIKG